MSAALLTTMKEVYETCDAEDANQQIRDGWKLLGVFQEAKESNGRQAAWALYVLGKPDPAATSNHVSKVKEAWSDQAANELLEQGWELLFTYTAKYDGEHPRFVLAWMTEPEQPKFTGNGVH